MKHVVRKEDIHLAVWPRHNGNFGFVHMSPRGTPEEQERHLIAECERIAGEIARHVDDVAGTATVWDTRYECGYCGTDTTNEPNRTDPSCYIGCCQQEIDDWFAERPELDPDTWEPTP